MRTPPSIVANVLGGEFKSWHGVFAKPVHESVIRELYAVYNGTVFPSIGSAKIYPMRLPCEGELSLKNFNVFPWQSIHSGPVHESATPASLLYAVYNGTVLPATVDLMLTDSCGTGTAQAWLAFCPTKAPRATKRNPRITALAFKLEDLRSWINPVASIVLYESCWWR